MNRYIVLLRGVMPTGKNKVPMAQLRDVMTQAGYQHVRTWIQSGNLLVDTPDTAAQTAEKVRALIAEHIGPELMAAARTREDIQLVLAGMPFPAGHDPARVFYGFFESPPTRDTVSALLARDWGDNELVITPHAAYMYIPGDYTKARLNAAALEKHGGVRLTMRNANTLNKLVEMAGTPPLTDV